MLKLSIKDLRIYWFTFLINFAFWTIMAPSAIENPDIYLMLPIGFGLLINMIPLGNDMRDGKDILYASLPINRSKIVMARYLSSFFMTAVAFLWIILLGLLLERYLPGLSGRLWKRLSPESIVILVLLITLIICIYLPFVYKFGFNALITGGVAITAIVMAGFWLGASYLISSNSELLGIKSQESANAFNALRSSTLFHYLSEIMEHYGRIISLALIILFIIAVIAVSLSISINIFNRKEL